jgi:hypothetical protein
LKASCKCDNVSLKILGKDFWANLIILELKGIDVILGMGWLTACDVVIQCAKRSILLTSPTGERIKVLADPPSIASTVNQLEDIRVVCEYPNVLPEETLRMPPGKSGMLEAKFSQSFSFSFRISGRDSY